MNKKNGTLIKYDIVKQTQTAFRRIEDDVLSCKDADGNDGEGEICGLRTCPSTGSSVGGKYVYLKKDEILLTPDEQRAVINADSSELFNREGNSAGHFYVVAFVNDVNGAYADFNWDIETIDGSGATVQPRTAIPYNMLNSDTKTLGESNLPS